MNRLLICTSVLLVTASITSLDAARYNAFGQKHYTIQNEHFRIHYPTGLEHVARQVGGILDELYDIYRNTYHITLPTRTEVLISDDDRSGGWALTIENMIHIWANDFDYDMRGTGENLRNVVAHEYAHIVSISSSFKMPSWMPYLQFGYFSHPNNMKAVGKEDDRDPVGLRVEAFHIFPSEILPPWFFEGIAQYESTVNKGDRWDTHRDMILRARTLSNSLLSRDHMSVFTGKEYECELTYNHGFSLVSYIAETYGYEKVVSILREASKFGRVRFDKAIEACLGLTGRELYEKWRASLKKHYEKQVTELGDQVFGRKISKDGYDNILPRFGPDDSLIYFLSNGKHDFAYSFKKLYSYDPCDTVEVEKRIKLEMPAVKQFYDIHEESRRIVFTSMKSRKSTLSSRQGGARTRDVFIDTLPPADPKARRRLRKTERQVTEKQSMFHAAFSPSGDMIACTKHVRDRYYLYLADTSGKELRRLYPPDNMPGLDIKTIYSVDWSPNGTSIAVSYIDRHDRKIGVFDTASGEFSVICDTEHDERDPRFTPDGRSLLFSSDRSGIYNVYRYGFENGLLQCLTNVSGGAFMPDVSINGTMLVYANYDKDGYGIYLIDSVSVQEEAKPDSAVVLRQGVAQKKLTASYSRPQTYNRFPRQFLLIPTFFAEQILTTDDKWYRGITHTKLGAVFNLNDPMEWADKGSYIGGYFLTEPKMLFHRNYIIDPQVSYDFGVFGSTKLLPMDVSAFYAGRSIAGEDDFLVDYYGDSSTVEKLQYALNPKFFDLTLTHWINKALGIHVLTGFNIYDVAVRVSVDGAEVLDYFPYRPAVGFRVGAYTTFRHRSYDARMNISPKGLYGKLKYEFWHQKLQNEIRSFVIEGGAVKENYHPPYRYNQVSGSVRYGMAAPWHDKHDIHITLDATAVSQLESSKERLQADVDGAELPSTDLPSYIRPGAWVPGYAYYFRDTAVYHYVDTSGGPPPPPTVVPTETLLISGNGVASAGVSYRFPLTPRPIDRKFWFLYLDRLYGAVNAGGAVAVDRLSDMPELSLEDIFFWRGIELRLEATSFCTFPLAISARWDYGAKKNLHRVDGHRLGGHRFTLSIGFSFDNWDIIVEPDGSRFRPNLAF